MRLSVCVSSLGATALSGFVLIVAGVGAASIAPAALGAQVCYEDDRGRIVNRRRPGYLRVECPQPEAEEAADRVEGSAARAAGDKKKNGFD